MFPYEKYAFHRDKRGITDYRVSVETGIVPATFYDWKAGRYEPKIEKIMKIAKLFNLPLEAFISSGE